MGRTFAQSIEARDAHWIAIVTIEGSGVAGDKLYKYCSEIPAYGLTDASYRDWLTEYPNIAPEEVDETGGLPSNGELTVSILDYGDAITSEWRTEADPTTYVKTEISGTATTIFLHSIAGLAAGSLLFINNEAMEVVSVDPLGPTAEVVRGVLDTDPFKHLEGTPVYVHLPYLRARRMRLFLVNKDASSASQETEIGSYRIDASGLDENLNAWIVRGRSVLTWLSRVTAGAPPRTITAVPSVLGAGRTDFRVLELSDALTRDLALGSAFWPGGSLVARVQETGELVEVNGGLSWEIATRGLLNTKLEALPETATLRIVYAADPALGGSFFRWSPTSSFSRGSGTWISSANWIDIILNLITSSADRDDGLELNNRNPTYGAWDCLPPGIGIGCPHTEVELDAAIAVRGRTPDYVFPDFVIGDEPEPFADVITRHFLKPIGAFLSTVGGRARIVLPRLGFGVGASVELGPADMLSRPINLALEGHEIGAEQNLTATPTSVVFKLSNGQPIEVRNAMLVQPPHYAHETKPIEIEAPSARTLSATNPDANRAHFLTGRGMQRILRARRPPWLISPSISSRLYNLAVGDPVLLTHPELRDLSTGRKGWTQVYAEITRITPHLDPERGFWLQWQARTFGPNVRAAKIAPAARIDSMDDSSGDILVTVTENRYTHADAPAPLPNTDAAAFTVGDFVELRSRAGVNLAPGEVAKILAITGNVIQLDGDLGGYLTAGAGNAGQVLRYATSANAEPQQLDGFVYWADVASRTIGATTRAPRHYGEP